MIPSWKVSLALVLIALACVLCLVTGSNCPCEAPRRVLAIGAANAVTDWTQVEASSNSLKPWYIEYIELEGFAETMKTKGFQAALDQTEKSLLEAISRVRPDALLVASKGVGIVTFLASKGLWNGPCVLISPIPNACDHIVGGSWEAEWKSTMNVLVSNNVGPIAIGVGDSLDEQSLIVDMIQDTEVCGFFHLVHDAGWFEKCPLWTLHSFPGNHGWKNDPPNVVNIASLIDYVFTMHERNQTDGLQNREL